MFVFHPLYFYYGFQTETVFSGLLGHNSPQHLKRIRILFKLLDYKED